MSFEIILAALATAAGVTVAGDAGQDVLSALRRLMTRKVEASNGDSAAGSLDTAIAPIGARELSLEERLAELTDLMMRSAILVEQVSAELDARVATARKLDEEAKQAEELASINRAQAEAIHRLMDADLAAKLTENSVTIRKDVRKDAIRIGVGSFVAGGGLTLLITLLVHPLH